MSDKYILVTHTSFCDKTKGWFYKEVEGNKNEVYSLKVLENDDLDGNFNNANSFLIPIRDKQTTRKLTFMERLTGRLSDE